MKICPFCDIFYITFSKEDLMQTLTGLLYLYTLPLLSVASRKILEIKIPIFILILNFMFTDNVI